MTQEEKQLLLKDLCARLPYGVRYKGDGGWGINPYQHSTSLCTILTSEEPLVYLRPMSSMTEEEKEEYHRQVDIDLGRTAEVLRAQLEAGTFHPENKFTPQYCHIDWLNANHFDYRGLIEKGLALEAPEGMYKNE